MANATNASTRLQPIVRHDNLKFDVLVTKTERFEVPITASTAEEAIEIAKGYDVAKSVSVDATATLVRTPKETLDSWASFKNSRVNPSRPE